ncbi:MAG TPA: alanine racemase [Candidatus Limnocylindria bacterium]|nr:alanine racemase [Candidatus Limnocylindria bacterium]
MRPSIELHGDALRANARAFAALGAPVAAVVKNDGYGWGALRLARELNDVVESYVVADDDELAALRPGTRLPIRLLSDVPAPRVARVLALGGIPNVSSREALAPLAAEAERRGGLTVRVGIHDASGWSAIAPGDAAAFAAALAGTKLAVELWTHVSSADRAGAQLAAFAAARDAFARAGVLVVGTDVASTGSACAANAHDRLRIGVGLFGARLGAPVVTHCALRVRAPLVRRHAPGTVAFAGYGDRRISDASEVVVLRCGYGDGYPKGMAGAGAILAVGMQYTTRLWDAGTDPCVLIGEADALDDLAAQAGISAHELVVGLA